MGACSGLAEHPFESVTMRRPPGLVLAHRPGGFGAEGRVAMATTSERLGRTKALLEESKRLHEETRALRISLGLPEPYQRPHLYLVPPIEESDG
jgi:hypothetical protein